jgi:RND family efflux transporter MFP subunit
MMNSFEWRANLSLLPRVDAMSIATRARARIVASALLASSLALTACDTHEKDVRLLPPLVVVTTVKPAGPSQRAFTGILAARVESNLGFRVGGKIVERLVDTGASVRAGQSLFRIDRSDFALLVAAQEQAVAAARARLTQASAAEARYRALIETGAISVQAYEQAKAAADSATAELSAAQAQAAVIRNQGDYSVLRADADGVVVETLAEPGQVVAAGQLVAKLAHAGPREAAVFLPETVRPRIGSAAQATLYGSNNPVSAARLRQLSDAADALTRTYEARYVLEGDAAHAPLGATVTVQIADAPASGLLQVPLSTIYDAGKGPGVWVLNANTSSVIFRPVQIWVLGAETAVVGRGLHEGEQIVALGARQLREGTQVRVAGTELASP